MQVDYQDNAISSNPPAAVMINDVVELEVNDKQKKEEKEKEKEKVRREEEAER